MLMIYKIHQHILTIILKLNKCKVGKYKSKQLVGGRVKLPLPVNPFYTDGFSHINWYINGGGGGGRSFYILRGHRSNFLNYDKFPSLKILFV